MMRRSGDLVTELPWFRRRLQRDSPFLICLGIFLMVIGNSTSRELLFWKKKPVKRVK